MGSSELPRIRNSHRLQGPVPPVCGVLLNLLDHIEALHNLSKHDMPAEHGWALSTAETIFCTPVRACTHEELTGRPGVGLAQCR